MDIYKTRIELPYTEEFRAYYLIEMRAVARKVADKIGEQYGAEAKRNIEANIKEYIKYAISEKNI